VKEPTNWCDLYVHYTDNQESPEVFQFWSAISVMSSMLGRRVYFERGHFTTFANQYIFITAETANTRKSSASENAVEKIMEPIGLVDLMTERLTTEAICEHLSSNAVENSVLIFCTELSTFLGAGALQTGKIDMLTSLYSCPAKKDYKTKNMGKYKLRNISINILACTTLNWMEDNMPGTTIEGGFIGRVLFIVGETPRCIDAAMDGGLSLEKQEIKQALQTDLKRIAGLNGNFKITPLAKQLYKDWYYKLRTTPITDPRLGGYFGRKGEHVLKVAMALRVAEFDVKSQKDLVLDVQHIQRAIDELQKVEDLMPHAYRGAAYSASSKDNDRIMRQLKKAKGGLMDHSALLKRNTYYLNGEEFKRVMFTLTDAGMVDEIIEGKKRYYKLK